MDSHLEPSRAWPRGEKVQSEDKDSRLSSCFGLPSGHRVNGTLQQSSFKMPITETVSESIVGGCLKSK